MIDFDHIDVTQSGASWQRTYTVALIPDNDERKRALAEYAKGWHAVVPEFDIPDEIKQSPLPALQAWLDQHPLPRRYYRLHLLGEDIDDATVHKLQLFPEIRDVVIIAKRVTDTGVRHLTALREIMSLVLYCPLVTATSLEYIASLRKLTSLDLQGCPGIDPGEARAMVARSFSRLEFWAPCGTT